MWSVLTIIKPALMFMLCPHICLTSYLRPLWNVENGIPKSSILFEVMDAGITQFSPNEQFMAVGREFENTIEL